jgi:hypothetical protein
MQRGLCTVHLLALLKGCFVLKACEGVRGQGAKRACITPAQLPPAPAVLSLTHVPLSVFCLPLLLRCSAPLRQAVASSAAPLEAASPLRPLTTPCMRGPWTGQSACPARMEVRVWTVREGAVSGHLFGGVQAQGDSQWDGE